MVKISLGISSCLPCLTACSRCSALTARERDARADAASKFCIILEPPAGAGVHSHVPGPYGPPKEPFLPE